MRERWQQAGPHRVVSTCRVVPACGCAWPAPLVPADVAPWWAGWCGDCTSMWARGSCRTCKAVLIAWSSGVAPDGLVCKAGLAALQGTKVRMQPGSALPSLQDLCLRCAQACVFWRCLGRGGWKADAWKTLACNLSCGSSIVVCCHRCASRFQEQITRTPCPSRSCSRSSLPSLPRSR